MTTQTTHCTSLQCALILMGMEKTRKEYKRKRDRVSGLVDK